MNFSMSTPRKYMQIMVRSKGNRKRQLPVFVERETEKGPYHEQLALDEAHETRSAVDQTVAERDEPVDAADDQGAYQYLQEHEGPLLL